MTSATGRGRRRDEERERRSGTGGRPGERFPAGPGESAKRGDPPLERAHGERSRHGEPGGEREEEP